MPTACECCLPRPPSVGNKHRRRAGELKGHLRGGEMATNRTGLTAGGRVGASSEVRPSRKARGGLAVTGLRGLAGVWSGRTSSKALDSRSAVHTQQAVWPCFRVSCRSCAQQSESCAAAHTAKL